MFFFFFDISLSNFRDENDQNFLHLSTSFFILDRPQLHYSYYYIIEIDYRNFMTPSTVPWMTNVARLNRIVRIAFQCLQTGTNFLTRERSPTIWIPSNPRIPAFFTCVWTQMQLRRNNSTDPHVRAIKRNYWKRKWGFRNRCNGRSVKILKTNGWNLYGEVVQIKTVLRV